jgi:ATP-dependent DNA helicase RecQ
VTELGSFALPEQLSLEIRKAPWIDRMEVLVHWISQRTGPGIVFAPTRPSTLRIARVLESLGKRVLCYHAGLSSEERRLTEKKVADQEVDVLVSTSAFGMGMDYPHLIWALLWQPPLSLLQLTQALGRVGRNPKVPSRALVLWSPEDFKLMGWAIGDSSRIRSEVKRTLEFLEKPQCRTEALTHYFGNHQYNDTRQPVALHQMSLCKNCDFCLNLSH